MGISGGVSVFAHPVHCTTSHVGQGPGAGVSQGGPSSETCWSQHIAHAKELRPAARTDLPHQSRDAQSLLAPLGDPGLDVPPEVQAG